MIPHEPPRNPNFGFLYFPPFRVQGYSIAGEETFVQIPELDVCFDIGRAGKIALTSNHVALTHGHMDHTAGLPYYFSQRHFQGMGEGTVLCPQSLVEPIRAMMMSWADVESQRTPFKIVGIDAEGPGSVYELKNHFYLQAYPTDHTVPSVGYAVVEKRSKLKEEYAGLPQEKLVELKAAGEEITFERMVSQVAYTGDTGPCSAFRRDEVVNAKILITECTFIDDDHRSRARVGKHMHISDLVEVLDIVNCEQIVITHLSRRTHIAQARDQLDRMVPKKHRDRLHILMDGRTNRARYARQVEESERKAAENAASNVAG